MMTLPSHIPHNQPLYLRKAVRKTNHKHKIEEGGTKFGKAIKKTNEKKNIYSHIPINPQ